MMPANGAVADDKDVLQGDVLQVLPRLLEQGQTEAVLEVVRALVKRNEQLENHLAKVLSRGTRANEGVSSAQLKLFLEELRQQGEPDEDEQAGPTPEDDEELKRLGDEAAERARAKLMATVGGGTRRRPLKKPLPANLPRRPNKIPVPEEQRACPKCGGERECIGHDISEVLEFQPAQLYVRQDMREKLQCRPCDSVPDVGPRGDKVVAGGQIGCSTVAKILYDKYWVGLPLHRQHQEFGRLGYGIPVSTLADQVQWGAELLTPLWMAAKDQMFASLVMHIDGTGLPALDRDRVSGKKLGTLWATVGANENGPQVAAYFYASSKKAKGQRDDELGPHDILSRRKGIVVADADGLFTSQMARDDLLDCGCNMHARRYFIKALDGGDQRAALPIGAFKRLYQIEEEIAGKPPDERTATRQEQSKPIYDELIKWCRKYQDHEPPKSRLGQGISYLLNHENALCRFLDDGRIPIDNGAAERAFIRVALTRKNFLFVGSDAGGDRAAIVYTVLACCHLVGVDPIEYLTDTLAVLSRGIRFRDAASLLPAAWQARRQAQG